ACMPEATIARDWASTRASLTSWKKRLKPFHPIGGVCASAAAADTEPGRTGTIPVVARPGTGQVRAGQDRPTAMRATPLRRAIQLGSRGPTQLGMELILRSRPSH